MKYETNVWYGWNGGACPVHPMTVVEYITAVDGPERKESSYGKVAARDLCWTPAEDGWDVIALAPSLARRVIAAEKLVDLLEQTDEGEISGELYWALQAYREASK